MLDITRHRDERCNIKRASMHEQTVHQQPERLTSMSIPAATRDGLESIPEEAPQAVFAIVVVVTITFALAAFTVAPVRAVALDRSRGRACRPFCWHAGLLGLVVGLVVRLCDAVVPRYERISKTATQKWARNCIVSKYSK